jgi:hypothetical protein
MIHSAVGVCLSKSTHAACSFTAQTARQNGASVDGTKALGGWSENGSFRPCYDRALPLEALLGAATFNARKPESYFLPRDLLGEPFSHGLLFETSPLILCRPTSRASSTDIPMD